jgi:hypothetical protein
MAAMTALCNQSAAARQPGDEEKVADAVAQVKESPMQYMDDRNASLRLMQTRT